MSRTCRRRSAVPRASRHSSAASGTGPKRARARARASAAAHASGDELLRLAFEMEGQLVVELAFDAARREQRTHAQAPVAEAHRVYASFMTRPIAVDMRSHSRASTASCRRPDAVSW